MKAKYPGFGILALAIVGIVLISGCTVPGSQGPQGPKGDTGTIGSAGPQGPKGDTGATGPAGPQGPQGLKGDTGTAGPAGPQGLEGVSGYEALHEFNATLIYCSSADKKVLGGGCYCENMNAEFITWTRPISGNSTNGWQCFCREEGKPCCKNPWDIYVICADAD